MLYIYVYVVDVQTATDNGSLGCQEPQSPVPALQVRLSVLAAVAGIGHLAAPLAHDVAPGPRGVGDGIWRISPSDRVQGLGLGFRELLRKGATSIVARVSLVQAGSSLGSFAILVL